MEYITDVRENGALKHIVRINGKNVEVVECDLGGYSNSKQELAYHYENISVMKGDFKFFTRSSSYPVHLSEVVIAIELAKFIKSETE